MNVVTGYNLLKPSDNDRYTNNKKTTLPESKNIVAPGLGGPSGATSSPHHAMFSTHTLQTNSKVISNPTFYSPNKWHLNLNKHIYTSSANIHITLDQFQQFLADMNLSTLVSALQFQMSNNFNHGSVQTTYGSHGACSSDDVSQEVIDYSLHD